MEARHRPGAGARPLDAAEVLAWMRENGSVLRELVSEESVVHGDESASSDSAIRAHLRFAARAMEATARAPLAGELEGLSAVLPAGFSERRDLYAEHLRLGEGAVALEEHLQFGARPGSDPSLDAALTRRVRIGGWIRVFLEVLEEHLGPRHDGVAEAAMAWLGDRQRDLARLIFSLDRRAKMDARNRGVGGPEDAPMLDQIGRVAVVQGYIRMLIEALAETFAGQGGRPSRD